MGQTLRITAGTSIQAGEGNDRIIGTSGEDTIRGFTGNDSIITDLGSDLVYGGAGDDLIADEYVYYIEFNDYMGNSSAYYPLSGRLYGNLFYGGSGNDTIYGGNNPENTPDDTIYGGDDSDHLYGDASGAGRGNDLIYGGNGSDFIFGNQGNDDLNGGTASDMLFGGQGNDLIAGGGDNDLLVGGQGADQFRFFSTNFGNDQIADFSQAQGDKIILVTGTAYTVSDLGSDILINVGGNSILLFAVADFNPAMIDFAG